MGNGGGPGVWPGGGGPAATLLDRGESAGVPTARGATVLAISVGALVAAVVALRARPEVMFDDAAITFRYALRLAEGAGFTFNDGDRTNGASAPLYTLLLAGAARAGARPESAAAAIGVVAYASTVALVGVLADRLAGWWAAVVAMALLVTSTVFQNQALSGMESGLASALGMATLVALAWRRTTLAGVLIGLALVNRLDAAALGVAAVVVVTWSFRTVPRRLVLAALAVSVPWFVFATWYFGSPVPHSATQKLAGRAGAAPFDPTWFVHSITGREGLVVALLAASIPLVLAVPGLRAELGPHPTPTSPTAATSRAVTPSPAVTPSTAVTEPTAQRWAVAAMLTGLVWSAVHTVVYSAVDLGAPYPWYTAVVFPVLATGAGVALVVLARRARRGPAVLGVALIGLAVLVVLSRASAVEHTARTVVDGEQVRASRELDRTRRDAGRLLGAHAGPDDVIRTCFGWVAYGAPFHPIDEVCPLSTRRPVGPPRWVVESPAPGEEVVVPPDATLHAELVTPPFDGERARTRIYRAEPPG